MHSRRELFPTPWVSATKSITPETWKQSLCCGDIIQRKIKIVVCVVIIPAPASDEFKRRMKISPKRVYVTVDCRRGHFAVTSLLAVYLSQTSIVRETACFYGVVDYDDSFQHFFVQLWWVSVDFFIRYHDLIMRVVMIGFAARKTARLLCHWIT